MPTDYTPGGNMAGCSAGKPELSRSFDEVMHGHAEKIATWQGRLKRRETGTCGVRCALARRDVFDRIGPPDDKLMSTQQQIDF